MKKPFLFSGTIPNCFDSHVHWRGTGNFAQLLDLKEISGPEEVQYLKIAEHHYQGEWLIGYGWDQNKFPKKKFPTRTDIDQIFANTPVLFKRIDGHAVWVNTEALKRANMWERNIEAPYGGRIVLDSAGWPTGILIDQAIQLIYKYLPQDEIAQQKKELLMAQQVFHRAGFTHIRDLTCEDRQWQAATELETSGQLQMAVEQFFSADDPNDFDQRLALAIRAKSDYQLKISDGKSPQNNGLLRPKGIKIYFDGALGSEGALISRDYQSGSGRGLQLIHENDLITMMIKCCEHDLDLAIHTIGDEAADRVVNSALKLDDNSRFNFNANTSTNILHLEHVELLRPETINKLSQLNVHCHMQPSHWLSDKKWLHDKIGSLAMQAFQWRSLEDFNISFTFGSDSPIEPTSMQKNIDAMADAAEFGLLATQKSPWHYHAHSDLSWLPNTYTVFADGRPQEIYFRGKKLTI